VWLIGEYLNSARQGSGKSARQAQGRETPPRKRQQGRPPVLPGSKLKAASSFEATSRDALSSQQAQCSVRTRTR